MHDGKIVEKSVLEGPNGEFIFHMVEDVTEYDKTSRLIREQCNGFSENRSRRMNVSVPPRLYYHWARLTGSEECWLDPSFLRSFIKEHPEYSTTNGRI